MHLFFYTWTGAIFFEKTNGWKWMKPERHRCKLQTGTKSNRSWRWFVSGACLRGRQFPWTLLIWRAIFLSGCLPGWIGDVYSLSTGSWVLPADVFDSNAPVQVIGSLVAESHASCVPYNVPQLHLRPNGGRNRGGFGRGHPQFRPHHRNYRRSKPVPVVLWVYFVNQMTCEINFAFWNTDYSNFFFLPNHLTPVNHLFIFHSLRVRGLDRCWEECGEFLLYDRNMFRDSICKVNAK